MVSRALWTNLGCGFLLGLVLLPIAALILNGIYGFTREDGMLFLGTLIGGGVLGAVMGKILAKTRGPHMDQTDRLAVKDDELLELMRVCKEKQYEPLLLWYYTATNTQPDKKAPDFSLGFADESREPIDFEEFATSAKMQSVG